MKRLIAAIVCSAAACLAARAAENYIPNDFDLSDGHEETISVASGDTDVYTGVFSGSGSVKKTGEVTNLVKLKVSMKSAEGKLSEVYEEIVRLFYTA